MAVVYEFERSLNPSVIRFVDRHVRSLLTWDVLVFFHRNPEAVLDLPGLASRLSRRVEELEPEVQALCVDRILYRAGGLVRYRPEPDLRMTIERFVQAGQEREQRLALIAAVLQKVDPSRPSVSNGG